jgi:hypothetical protein
MAERLVLNKLITADFDVYIGRPTKWCNPFKLSQYTRQESLRLFEAFLRENKQVRQEGALFLAGKRLGCFCATYEGLSVDDPVICHGQIWLKACRGDFDNE